MEQAEITCKNCDNVYTGNYCNMCRQPAETHRITWGEVLHFLFHAFFHADKGLLYTIKELFLRPGKTIRQYIQGKRINHFNPILFLIITGGIATILYSFLELRPPNESVELSKIEHLNATLAHKYFIVVGLLFIILLTITDYFFYFSRKYDVPELIISNSFQSGQIFVYLILFIPLLILQNKVNQNGEVHINLRYLLIAFSLAFVFFTRYQLYDEKSKIRLIIKIIVQIILVYVLYHFIIGLLVDYMQKTSAGIK